MSFRRDFVVAMMFVALVAAGCGSSGNTSSAQAGRTESKNSTGICRIGDESNCLVVGAVFKKPQTLAEIQQTAANLQGSITALWRRDAVCVTDVTGVGPGDFASHVGQQRRSAFAYWHADELVSRQQTMAPPATDGGYSNALQARFVGEWDSASKPGVKFIGAALYLPRTKNLDVTGADKTLALDSYRTDGAHVLYLKNHEATLAPLFPTVVGTCP